MGERTYDIVLLGATGFTGRLTADHLAHRLAGTGLTGTGLTWAIAGRNVDRLEEVRDGLSSAGLEPELEVVDTADLVGLLRLAERTRVLASTVGPYVQHGELVVQACVRSGTHYADITGEPAFVDLVRSRYDDDARERGVKVVNCCGFDSIPPDLGVRHAVAQLPDDAPITVRGFLQASGQPSGGTWASALEAIGTGELGGLQGQPRRDGHRQASPLPLRPVRADELGGVGLPLPTIDPSIVLRSAAGLDAYGPDFRFGYYLHTASPVTAAAIAGGAAVLAGVARIGPAREALKRLRPAGDGPSDEQRDKAWFRITFEAEAAGHHVRTRVSGDDPGYGGTAIMLGEAVLSLLEDDLDDVAGVLTPAQAFEGGHLQARLEAHGMTFEVLDVDA